MLLIELLTVCKPLLLILVVFGCFYRYKFDYSDELARDFMQLLLAKTTSDREIQ